MRSNPIFVRIQTWAILAIFTAGQGTPIFSAPVYAASSRYEAGLQNNFDPSQLEIPAELGTLRDSQVIQGAPLVILIQDAHAVGDAQASIQGLAGFLAENKGVRLFALEGASGKLDPFLFRAFPDQELLKKEIAGYVRRGELSGAAAAALTEPAAADYFGVEKKALYEKGLRLFLKAAGQTQAWNEKLAKIHAHLAALQKQHSSPELLKLESLLQAAETGEGIALLLDWLQKQPQTPLAAYPRLQALAKELSGSAQASPAMLDRFAAQVRSRLTGKKALGHFHQISQDYKTGQMSESVFAARLIQEAAGRGVFVPAEITALSARALLLESLQAQDFYEDLQACVRAVKARLFRNDLDRALDRAAQLIANLDKLVALKLTRQDWEALQDFQEVLPDEMNKLVLLRRQIFASDAADFYRNAEEREQIMHQNLLKRMRQMKVRTAVFVAGGYHTEGLLKRLHAEKISTLMLMPAIRRMDASTHYWAYMHDHVSWESYLNAKNGKIDLYTAFHRALRDRLLTAKPTLRNLWRNQVLQQLAQTGRLSEASVYTQFFDSTAPENAAAAAAAQQLWRAKVRKFLLELRGLRRTGPLDIKNLYGLLGVGHAAILQRTAIPLVRGTSPAMLDRAAAKLALRSEVRRSNEDLLFGVHDYEADSADRENVKKRKYYPDWAVMQMLGQEIFDKQESRPGPVKLDDILGVIQERLRGMGFNGSRYSESKLEELLLRLSSDEGPRLLKRQNNGYNTAVDLHRFAIQTGHVDYLRRSFESYLADHRTAKAGSGVQLEGFIEGVAAAVESWDLYPVEAAWPVLKAVTQLSKEDRNLLAAFLQAPTRVRLRERLFVDSVLYLLTGEISQDWMKKFAPTLEDTTLYYISPETWLAAGGLGRVGQYHTVAAKLLMGEKKNMVTIEPYYSHSTKLVEEKDGSIKEVLRKDIDYENSNQPVPVENLKLWNTFRVKVSKKGRRQWIDVEIFRGTNRHGVDVFLYKDKPDRPAGDSYFTKVLYGYQNPDHPIMKDFVTASEFAECASKVSLKLSRKIEAERQRLGQSRNPPVLWANDGQLALLPLFKRISDDLEDMSADEIERIRRDASHEYHEYLDLVQEADEISLLKATVLQTTHTYRNRLIRGEQDLVHNLRLPSKYRKYLASGEWLYLADKSYDSAYDATSAGVRSADLANGVAAIHAQEVSVLDQGVPLEAVTNGDARKATRQEWEKVFADPDFQRQFPGEDSEAPSPAALAEAKRRSKIRLSQNQKLRELNALFAEINPDQILFSYSGRMVDEKTGIERAFTSENIEALVRAGAQIIIMGNVQPGNDISKAIYKKLKELENKLYEERRLALGEGQPFGLFIVASGWGIPEQRYLLPAADVQVNDSDRDKKRGTEAAGVTETDAMAVGALELSSAFLEAIFHQQGIVLNWDKPGSGNTIVPESSEPGAYLNAMRRALQEYQKDRLRFAEFQKTSIVLSQILAAEITAMHYLHEIHKSRVRQQDPVGALRYFFTNPKAGKFFRSEWLREALVDQFDGAVESMELYVDPQRDQFGRILRTHHTRLRAYITNISTAGSRARIVVTALGMRPKDESREFSHDKIAGILSDGPGEGGAFARYFLSLGLDIHKDEDRKKRFRVVDVITGQFYGAYSVEEILKLGLPVELPQDVMTQVIELVPAEEQPSLEEATRGAIFWTEAVSPPIQHRLMDLFLPETFDEGEQAGKTPADLVWWTSGGGFVSPEKTPKNWSEPGFYLLVDKGSGRLTMTLTRTLENMLDDDRRRAMVFAGTPGMAHISLSVEGEDTLWIGFGRINLHDREPHRVFKDWFEQRLKPWSERLGFTNIKILQTTVPDWILQSLGFRLVDKERKIWRYVFEETYSLSERARMHTYETGESLREAAQNSSETKTHFSIKDVREFLAPSAKRFVWKDAAGKPIRLAPGAPGGLLGLAKDFRSIAGWGRNLEKGKLAAQSLRAHAERDEIFHYLLEDILKNSESNETMQPLVRKLLELHAAARSLLSQLPNSVPETRLSLLDHLITLNFEAIQEVDRFGYRIGGQAFENYWIETSAEKLKALHDNVVSNPLVSQYIARYLSHDPQAIFFGTDPSSIAAFGVTRGGEHAVIPLDVGSIAVPDENGILKARGHILADVQHPQYKVFLAHFGIQPGMSYGVKDKKTQQRYGHYQWDDDLRLGVPGIQMLTMFPQHAPIVAGLIGLTRHQTSITNVIRQLQKDIMAALNNPQQLRELIQSVASLPAEAARDAFGKQVTVIMALVAGLAPEFLDQLKDWHPYAYASLKRVAAENKELFENGEIFFQNVDRGGTLVFTRSLKGGDKGQNLIFTLQFEDFPIHPDGKVWSVVQGLGAEDQPLQLDADALYEERSLLNGEVTGAARGGAELMQEYNVGIPVWNHPPNHIKTQHDWGFDIFRLEKIDPKAPALPLESFPRLPPIPQLMISIHLLDVGAEVIFPAGEVIYVDSLSKVESLVPLLRRLGFGAVYFYGGLYRMGGLSHKVHSVDSPAQHILRDREAFPETMVVVEGYPTKKQGAQTDNQGNNFAPVDPPQLNPHLSRRRVPEGVRDGSEEQTLEDFRRLIRTTRALGMRTVFDFIAWVALEGVTAENYKSFFYKEVPPDLKLEGFDKPFNELPEEQKVRFMEKVALDARRQGAFVKRFGDPGNERLVMFKNMFKEPGVDQAVPNPFHPLTQPRHQRFFTFIVDEAAADGLRDADAPPIEVRMDLAHKFTQDNLKDMFSTWKAEGWQTDGFDYQGDESPLKQWIAEAKAYARSQGQVLEFDMEAYGFNQADQEHNHIVLKTYGADRFYNPLPYHFYRGFAKEGRGDAQSLEGVIQRALDLSRGTAKDSADRTLDAVEQIFFPTEYDDEPLRSMGGARRAFLLEQIALAKSGRRVMIDLRDFLDHRGQLITIPGPAHPFSPEDEKMKRPDFNGLRHEMENAPGIRILQDFAKLEDSEKTIQFAFFDSEKRYQFTVLSWRKPDLEAQEPPEWRTLVLNMKPHEDQMLWVQAPQGLQDGTYEALDVITGERFPVRDGKIQGLVMPSTIPYRTLKIIPLPQTPEAASRSEMRRVMSPVVRSLAGERLTLPDARRFVKLLNTDFEAALERLGILAARPRYARLYAAFHEASEVVSDLGEIETFMAFRNRWENFSENSVRTLEDATRTYLQNNQNHTLDFNWIMPHDAELEAWLLEFDSMIGRVASEPEFNGRVSAHIGLLASPQQARAARNFFKRMEKTVKRIDPAGRFAAAQTNQFLSLHANALAIGLEESQKNVAAAHQTRLVELSGLPLPKAFPLSTVILFQTAREVRITGELLRRIPEFLAPFVPGMLSYNQDRGRLIIHELAERFLLEAAADKIFASMA